MRGIVVLVLLAGLALAALPGPTVQTRPDQPSLSRSVPGIVDPQRLFATDDANETLHYDTDPSSGIGLTNGGTFWGGVRFTPTTGCTLKTILFYQWGSSNDDYVFIFGENNDTTPGAKLDSVPYDGTDSLQWKVINLASPLVLPAGTDFWVAVRITTRPARSRSESTPARVCATGAGSSRPTATAGGTCPTTTPTSISTGTSAP